MLIAIEGVNGVGKDFILNKLSRYKDKFELISSKPKDIVNKITTIDNMSSSELLDVSDSFVKHMEYISSTIRKDVNRKLFIANRWNLSNYVYTMATINQYFTEDDIVANRDRIELYKQYDFNILVPDIIIYLTSNPDIIKSRLFLRNKYTTRYEDEDMDNKIRELYESSLTKKTPKNIFIEKNEKGIEGMGSSVIIEEHNTIHDTEKILKLITSFL